VGPKNHALDGVEIPRWKGVILGVVRPIKNIGSRCCGVHSKRDNSGIVYTHEAGGIGQNVTQRRHVKTTHTHTDRHGHGHLLAV